MDVEKTGRQYTNTFMEGLREATKKFHQACLNLAQNRTWCHVHKGKT